MRRIIITARTRGKRTKHGSRQSMRGSRRSKRGSGMSTNKRQRGSVTSTSSSMRHCVLSMSGFASSMSRSARDWKERLRASETVTGRRTAWRRTAWSDCSKSTRRSGGAWRRRCISSGSCTESSRTSSAGSSSSGCRRRLCCISNERRRAATLPDGRRWHEKRLLARSGRAERRRRQLQGSAARRLLDVQRRHGKRKRKFSGGVSNWTRIFVSNARRRPDEFANSMRKRITDDAPGTRRCCASKESRRVLQKSARDVSGRSTTGVGASTAARRLTLPRQSDHICLITDMWTVEEPLLPVHRKALRPRAYRRRVYPPTPAVLVHHLRMVIHIRSADYGMLAVA
mmetsp:Transcript_123001/g.213402  ORF Transcript_123001/g.213402 Transcript_123001/m.213402 type:complete len:342 (-) Transcript_123001:338-1363(-)